MQINMYLLIYHPLILTPPLLLFLPVRHPVVLDYGVNHVFDTAGLGTNGAAVYKFYPPPGNTDDYTFVSECSNRGICATSTGLCRCFRGYTGDNCAVTNAASR